MSVRATIIIYQAKIVHEAYVHELSVASRQSRRQCQLWICKMSGEVIVSRIRRVTSAAFQSASPRRAMASNMANYIRQFLVYVCVSALHL